MLQPINFETETLKIHSFRISDIDDHRQLAADVLSIFSDSFTLKFVPTKRLNSIESAQDFIKTTIINHHIGRSHLHFITSKETQRVVGVVDLISPEVAKEHYKLDDYPYFIEFYLLKFQSGKAKMSAVLPFFIKHLQDNGLDKLAAVVNRNNQAAIKVLERSGFKLKTKFDILQDLYVSELI